MRNNFDKPWFGFITIFIVFVGDDWNSIMYDHYRFFRNANSPYAYPTVIFFMILYILGNLVLLNLFLAILLSNFDPTNTEVEVPDEEE